MSCYWCHNPEGRPTHSQIKYIADRCIGCLECVKACSNAAHIASNNIHIYNRERCVKCGACVDTCYTGALELTGKEWTVGQVMDEILSDSAYYKDSKGGVTLSGGEPVLSGEFAKAILESCKRENIHTAIETCGNYDWKKLAGLLPFIDLVMMDLKHMNSEKHRQATGQANEKIIENARNLAHTNKPILFRTPVIPTFNDTPEEISEIASFIKSLMELRNNNGYSGAKSCDIQYELLSFHKLAANKYSSLGLEYKAQHLQLLNNNKMDELKNIAGDFGVLVI